MVNRVRHSLAYITVSIQSADRFRFAPANPKEMIIMNFYIYGTATPSYIFLVICCVRATESLNAAPILQAQSVE